MNRHVRLLMAGVLAVALAAGLAPAAGAAVTLNGAGSSFAAPMYYKWADEYHKIHPDVSINYQSVGSGAGIRQITSGTVDFGGTDAFLTEEQIKAAPAELLHIPTLLGAVAISYNVPGVKTHLRLTPKVLADIYLGKITYWDAKEITSLNPGVKLPHLPIFVAHRSDASGTTNIFTNYLSKVSPEWDKKVGSGTSVNWPVGVGGKGNEGVSGVIKQNPGGIGYIELAYAVTNKLPYAALQNKAGRYVLPTIASTSAAAAGVAIPADYRVMVTDSPNPQAYPIVGFTWMLIYKNQTNKERGDALLKFIWWGLHDGEKMASSLLYAPLPPSLVASLEKTLKTVTYQGSPIL